VSWLLRVVRLVVVLALAVGTVTASAMAVAPQAKGLASAHISDHVRVRLDALAERSYIYDRYGNPLATLYDEQNRVRVKLSDISRPVVQAVLAVEDSHFYEHNGVNLRSIGRALSANLEQGSVEQGGSTITQQVVKNSIVGNKQDISRKLREAFLAVELEKQMSKNEILERYLNSIYLGNGAYGVQAASELYFGRDAKDLGWAEAALLAALIRSPVEYDPFRNPELSTRRRALVFRRLVEVGELRPAEVRLLSVVSLPVVPNRPRPADDYFVEQVKQQLLADTRLGATPTARFNAVFGGGLRIYTTFDPLAQQVAKEARDATLPNNNGDGTFTLDPDPITGAPRFGTAAMAAVEPRTGAVRVLVGGPGFDRYKYDLATQGTRQPGSSFKTFVLTALMEEGYSPTDLVDGRGPCADIPGYEKEPAQNFEGSPGGVATILSQTLKSSNCAYLRLGQIAGLEKVADVARRMGLTTPLEPAYASMAIGAQEVHPLDMAAAYSVLANDGIKNPPYFVDRVTDTQNRILFEHRPAGERVVSEQTARLVTEVLVNNVRSGTGTRARLTNGQEAAGKTGTTQDSSDVWFVGYTPQLSLSVWMGASSGRVSLSFGSGATGGRYPAATWGLFMNRQLQGAPVQAFPAPAPRPGGNCLRMPFAQSCSSTSTTPLYPSTSSNTDGTPPPKFTPAPAPAPVPPRTPPPASTPSPENGVEKKDRPPKRPNP